MIWEKHGCIILAVVLAVVALAQQEAFHSEVFLPAVLLLLVIDNCKDKKTNHTTLIRFLVRPYFALFLLYTHSHSWRKGLFSETACSGERAGKRLVYAMPLTFPSSSLRLSQRIKTHIIEPRYYSPPLHPAPTPPSVPCRTLPVIMNCPWILTGDLKPPPLTVNPLTCSILWEQTAWWCTLMAQREKFPPRRWMTGTDEMFDSVRETKEEEKREREQRGWWSEREEGEKHVWLWFVILSAIRLKMQMVADRKTERGSFLRREANTLDIQGLNDLVG